MFGMEHFCSKFLKHFHCMPEMMRKEEFPELKKDCLELYKKFLEAQIKHIDKKLEKIEEVAEVVEVAEVAEEKNEE